MNETDKSRTNLTGNESTLGIECVVLLIYSLFFCSSIIHIMLSSRKINETHAVHQIPSADNLCYHSPQIGSSVAATMSIDDRESTKLVLEVVAVAESNGLKLPREFGLLLKQVGYFLQQITIFVGAFVLTFLLKFLTMQAGVWHSDTLCSIT